jgi:hypothetical protein
MTACSNTSTPVRTSGRATCGVWPPSPTRDRDCHWDPAVDPCLPVRRTVKGATIYACVRPGMTSRPGRLSAA